MSYRRDDNRPIYEYIIHIIYIYLTLPTYVFCFCNPLIAFFFYRLCVLYITHFCSTQHNHCASQVNVSFVYIYLSTFLRLLRAIPYIEYIVRFCMCTSPPCPTFRPRLLHLNELVNKYIAYMLTTHLCICICRHSFFGVAQPNSGSYKRDCIISKATNLHTRHVRLTCIRFIPPDL